ncbi:hypothetical protein GCM10025866_05110 [Naasia aerilata]|uniref:Uncharacterized protein n=1 Tax=Naasia aerilata TaxID=1162966 RepID=A0ABM8G8S3_9MICO|nr:hypothetical protein GCM10025866_05110 [Naasia aerilata]
MHRDLGIVRAGLDAEVAAGRAGLERVTAESGQRLELGRLAAGEPEPVRTLGGDEQGRAEAEGDREAARGQPECLARVLGGATSDPPTAPVSPISRPAVIAAAAADQSCSSSTRPLRSRPAATSKTAKCSRSWAGVVMPA